MTATAEDQSAGRWLSGARRIDAIVERMSGAIRSNERIGDVPPQVDRPIGREEAQRHLAGGDQRLALGHHERPGAARRQGIAGPRGDELDPSGGVPADRLGPPVDDPHARQVLHPVDEPLGDHLGRPTGYWQRPVHHERRTFRPGPRRQRDAWDSPGAGLDPLPGGRGLDHDASRPIPPRRLTAEERTQQGQGEDPPGSSRYRRRVHASTIPSDRITTNIASTTRRESGRPLDQGIDRRSRGGRSSRDGWGSMFAMSSPVIAGSETVGGSKWVDVRSA